MPFFNEGYYEGRFLMPNGSAGSNTNARGGTWCSFWSLMDFNAQSRRNTEIDFFETYGKQPHLQAGWHPRIPAEQPPGATSNWVFRGEDHNLGVDLTQGWHRIGI